LSILCHSELFVAYGTKLYNMHVRQTSFGWEATMILIGFVLLSAAMGLSFKLVSGSIMGREQQRSAYGATTLVMIMLSAVLGSLGRNHQYSIWVNGLAFIVGFGSGWLIGYFINRRRDSRRIAASYTRMDDTDPPR
jgi:membrane associated rhomboid family serine protease